MQSTPFSQSSRQSQKLRDNVRRDRQGSVSPYRRSTDSLYNSSEDESEEDGKSDQQRARRGLAPGIFSAARRASLVEEEEEQPLSTATATATTQQQKEPPPTWRSLPEKGQLAVLTLARLSEPLAERSLSAYMFYQLKSFDPSLPDSTIAWQGGWFTSAFAAAQFLTAVWWGRAADTPWIGRKKVLLIGLFGTCMSCIGVGFSTSFPQALVFRAMAGALNGNVGVMRTMISEIIKEKK